MDVGALVNAGSTLLFRIAQTGHAAYLLERAAGAGQFGPAGTDRATQRFESAGTAVHGRGSAHCQCAAIPPAARYSWKFMCQITTVPCCRACMRGWN